MPNVEMSSYILQLKAIQPDLDEELVKKAFEFADIAHAGQKRFSGNQFITHPMETAKILAQWHLNTPCVLAGLLHDTVEDGAATSEDLQKEFGSTVTSLVEGVTKISDIRLRGSTEEQFVENLRKMIVVMSRDLRVVLVKLADRLHNMRTLQYVPENKRKKISEETLEIYAPLADRLAMGQVKGELEDLAFPHVYPDDYKWLIQYSAPYYKKAEERIDHARKAILKKLAEEGVKGEVHGRKKHLYSLYKKLMRPEINKDIDQVYDLVALRILVDDEQHCYTAFGIVHKLYKPVPKLGISDFVAQPKPNGYRSIHTKVFIAGMSAEIQIRTYKMHEEAEFGVASHLHYAKVKNAGATDEQLESGKVFADTDKLGWVKQLVELHNEVKDNVEMAEGLKLDVLSDRIFVYTPKGDVIDLPKNATPIDFAYQIHTSLGDLVTGAKVNGKMVSLNYKLTSGDICEITKSKDKKMPSQDWLKSTVTTIARTNINKRLRNLKS